MGMYTELHFNAELEHSTPAEVIDLLAYMVDARTTCLAELPEHALFATRRWEWMLTCHSAYFPLSVATSLDYENGRHHLRVRCNLKNYDGEIGLFLDWVMPYVNADTECLGYYRYEEDDHPELIYKTPPSAAAPGGPGRGETDEQAGGAA